MSSRIHKFQTVIISRPQDSIGRGSGNLISPNLVLSAAHNFYFNKQPINLDLFYIFPGAYGPLTEPYSIDNFFVPKQFETSPPS